MCADRLRKGVPLSPLKVIEGKKRAYTFPPSLPLRWSDVALPSLLVGPVPGCHRLVHPTSLRRGRQDMRSGLFAIPRSLLLPGLTAQALDP